MSTLTVGFVQAAWQGSAAAMRDHLAAGIRQAAGRGAQLWDWGQPSAIQGSMGSGSFGGDDGIPG